MIRTVVYYSGRVQGVGFRYTCSHIARRFHVTGQVRNLADGRVELIVEGETGEIHRYLADIAENMGGNIRDVQRSDQAATHEFAAFKIAK